MSKKEADYKKHVVDAFKERGWYAKRVEDQFFVGTLDLILCSPGTGLVLAEAKLIKSGKFGPSPRQFIEIDRITKAGGKWLMMGIDSSGKYHGYCGPLCRDDIITVGQCTAQRPDEAVTDFFLRSMLRDE